MVFTLSWWSGTEWAMSKSTYTAEMMKFQGKGQGPTLELSLPVTGPMKCPCLGLGSFSSHRKASHLATWTVTHPVSRPSLERLAPRPRALVTLTVLAGLQCYWLGGHQFAPPTAISLTPCLEIQCWYLRVIMALSSVFPAWLHPGNSCRNNAFVLSSEMTNGGINLTDGVGSLQMLKTCKNIPGSLNGAFFSRPSQGSSGHQHTYSGWMEPSAPEPRGAGEKITRLVNFKFSILACSCCKESARVHVNVSYLGISNFLPEAN